MADDLPPFSFARNDDGDAVVRVDGVDYASREALLAAAPYLRDAAHLGLYARAVNHLARGYKYKVIEDPESFRADYEAELAEELASRDPDAEPVGGVTQLIDFGKPELSLIHAPQIEGDTLVFFARSKTLGIPYRVEAPASGEPSYQPMDMAPLD